MNDSDSFDDALNDEQLEKQHWDTVVASFSTYGSWANRWLEGKRHEWSLIPLEDRLLLPSMDAKFDRIASAIKYNDHFLHRLIPDRAFSPPPSPTHLFEANDEDYAQFIDGEHSFDLPTPSSDSSSSSSSSSSDMPKILPSSTIPDPSSDPAVIDTISTDHPVGDVEALYIETFSSKSPLASKSHQHHDNNDNNNNNNNNNDNNDNNNDNNDNNDNNNDNNNNNNIHDFHHHSHDHAENSFPSHSHSHDAFPSDDDNPLLNLSLDYSKVCSTLKQFVRDWSDEGAKERSLNYGPILSFLASRWPDPASRAAVRVLVPGCGLGRLPWELVRLGFSAQGNEFAFYMLFASNFVLNAQLEPRSIRVFPFLHNLSNHASCADLLRPVLIPDVAPHMHVPEGSDFSMCAGDFVEVYSQEPEAFDAVATCFFLDTAHNVVQYLRTIHRCLRPGGAWVNLGPLLYHFADTPAEHSIELSLDELLLVARRIGFVALKEPEFLNCPYAQNPKSMMHTIYSCAFFVFQKV